MDIISRTPPSLLCSRPWDGLRVGLFGGSFNPPHAGHVHVAMNALKSLQLDYIWWLVSPQNPLKPNPPPPTSVRMAMCRDLIDDPRLIVSDLEDQFGTRYTFDTVHSIRKNFPRTDFIWISGMDIAHDLHRWARWRDLLELISFTHLTRPPADSLVQSCPLRLYAKQNHVFVHRAARYDLSPGSTYWMMDKQMVDISSTILRNNK